MPDAPNNREGSQTRKPSKCLHRWSYRERLAKGAFWSSATRGLKKDSDRAITPVVEAVCVTALLALPGYPQAEQLRYLHTQFSLGQSFHRQKNSCTYACWFASVVSYSLRPCGLWLARLLCQGVGFTKQEYWSVLANTGCHTLLEHCISCCPSHQLPWVPGAARTPVTQAAAPPPHLALTGANTNPPGKPQEQTPVDDPNPKVVIKPQLKPRCNVTKEEDPKPSH